MGRPRKDGTFSETDELSKPVELTEMQQSDEAQESNLEPSQPETGGCRGQKDGKVRIRHSGNKAAKVIAGCALIEFDDEGRAEVDAEAAEYLLGIPGYEEVN